MKKFDIRFEALGEKLLKTSEIQTNPRLIVDGILPPDIIYAETPSLTDHDIIVVAEAVRNEIELNTKFDIVYCASNPRDFVECESMLWYINERHIVQDYLEGMHHAECIIKFVAGKPKILSNLAIFAKDGPEHDRLYFTTKALHTKIIEIMDEEGL